MSGAACQIDPACGVFDKEKHVEGLKREGFHRQKIAGQELLLVMSEKGAPGAARP